MPFKAYKNDKKNIGTSKKSHMWMNENTVRLFNIHFFINRNLPLPNENRLKGELWLRDPACNLYSVVKDRVSAFIAFRTVYILLTKNGRTKTWILK